MVSCCPTARIDSDSGCENYNIGESTASGELIAFLPKVSKCLLCAQTPFGARSLGLKRGKGRLSEAAVLSGMLEYRMHDCTIESSMREALTGP